MLDKIKALIENTVNNEKLDVKTLLELIAGILEIVFGMVSDEEDYPYGE